MSTTESLDYFHKVYDPAHLRDLLGSLRDRLPRYLEECRDGWPTRPVDGTFRPFAMKPFHSSMDEYLKYARRLHSPKYMGHQVPPVIPLAGVAEALVGVTNNGLAIREMAPLASRIEQAVIEKLGAKIGWEREPMAGIATSGGTLANLTAILAARHQVAPAIWDEGFHDPSLVIIASEASHYSISRAAGVAGFGTSKVLPCPLDDAGRMDPRALLTTLEDARATGLRPVCIVASAPSTPEGAIDPLAEIGRIAREHQIWFHVDAVHGATGLFSSVYAKDLDGIELADSVAWDAHKMMHVPSLSTYLLYRNRDQSFLPFKQKASYLFEEGEEESRWRDGAHRTFECTKRATSVPLWMVWRHYGDELFARIIDRCYDLTRTFHGMLQGHPEFEAVHAPMTNILAFRHIPERCQDLDAHQKRLRNRVVERGAYYITSTDTRGLHCLRVTIINPLTTEAELQGLLDEIVHVALA